MEGGGSHARGTPEMTKAWLWGFLYGGFLGWGLGMLTILLLYEVR